MTQLTPRGSEIGVRVRGSEIGVRVRQALLKVLVSGHGRPIGSAILLLFLLASLAPTPLLISGLQFALFDAYQRLAPRKPTSTHAVIVAIDQKSLEELGQWPWPRTTMADLILALEKIGPAAIGVDVLMPEPDRMSPANIATIVERLDPQLSRRLARLPSNDSILAGAFSRQPVALGVAGASELDSDRKSTRLNSSHGGISRMPSSA